MPHHTASPPTDLVVFGGTGDLAMRKLLPALFLCDRDGGLAPETRIIAASRDGLADADFRDKAAAAVCRPAPPCCGRATSTR